MLFVSFKEFETISLKQSSNCSGANKCGFVTDMFNLLNNLDFIVINKPVNVIIEYIGNLYSIGKDVKLKMTNVPICITNIETMPPVNN